MRTTPQLVLPSILMVPFLTSAQPAIQWQKCLGGTSGDEENAVLQTADAGYVVAGYAYSNNGDVNGNLGENDAWVVKLNSIGTIEWQTCLGGSESDVGNSIHQTADGGYVVAGKTQSDDEDVSGWHVGYNDLGNPNPDAWVVKLDGVGGIQWQRCLGGADRDEASSVQQTADGGYVVAGHTNSIDGDASGNHGGNDAWLIKLSGSGDIQWQKCLGGTEGDHLGAVLQTADGGYLVAGHTQSNDGDVSGLHGTTYDAWVVKVSGTGDVLWVKVLGGTGWDQAYSVQQTVDGGYVLAGYTQSNDGDVLGNHGSQDAWVVKLDVNGDIQWQRCLGGSAADRFYSIRQIAGGGFLAAGSAASHDGDVSGVHSALSPDVWVVELDNVGSIQWQKCLGGSNSENANSIQQTADGCVIAGHVVSYDGDVVGSYVGSGGDGWVVKLGPNEVGIDGNERVLFTLAPNPTRSVFTVQHSENPSPKEMLLLDATGRTIMSRPTAASTGNWILDLSGHESGLYFVRLRFTDGSSASKCVVKE